MAFYTQSELSELGFKFLGRNVKISNKAAIYGHENISIGDNSRVDDFCVISGRVTIGRNVHMAVYSHLAGGRPGITMEDFSGLAYGVQVFTQSDDYSGKSMTNPTVPSKYKLETEAAVHIGRHCIIGTNALILPGVTIAEGTSVGAMSMVTKSTETWSIYFGTPAKRIKKRSKELLDLERQYLTDSS